jgi:hypothetical protein
MSLIKEVRNPMSILKEIHCTDWFAEFDAQTRAQAIEAIENGKILLFPKLAFELPEKEKKFLSPVYACSRLKNISFNPRTQKVTCADCTMEDYENLKKMMKRYAQVAEKLVCDLFPSYGPALLHGRTSYRPVHAARRRQSDNKNDTLLHVDAFPATPIHGKRILRVFTNINPVGKDRLWRVGEPFPDVAKQFVPKISPQFFGKAFFLKLFKITKTLRSDYDHYMLQIHDRMKANKDYQQNAPQAEILFAAGSTWVVQTDQVPHAAMSGQYMMEQTFYLPVSAMANPELSPLRIMEKITGRVLA